MKIIGTAGHVDHGKSTLISALTGIHPDRLKEEKEREMTIELGFGSLTLPNGEEVGIVDVPGHRDFIGNMLAGIGGIDAVLLVIAADEGIMPQTREHLDIIHLLDIRHGIIVLTKTDMIDDPEWLTLVENDIQNLVKQAGIQNFPLVKVSAKKNRGIDELKQIIQQVLAETPQKVDHGRPRLSVDRVFSMTGFGTVITGTLIDGVFEIGDDILCLPSGRKGKIRGLQTHNHKVEIALPGSRTAINISGINTEQIQRGDVITKAGDFFPTQMIDALIMTVDQPEFSLKNNTEVKVFLGSAEVVGTLRLLGKEAITNQAEGFCQLQLKEEVIAAKHDRFILRRPSPSETLGGGIVIATDAKKRYKRNDPKIIERLGQVLKGGPAELLANAALGRDITQARELFGLAGLNMDQGLTALQECINDGTLHLMDPIGSSLTAQSSLIHSARFADINHKIEELVQEYHKLYPLRKGIPKEELKSKLNLPTKQLPLFLNQTDFLDGIKYVANKNHQIKFSTEDHRKVNSLISRMESEPYSTPSVADCKFELGEELFNAVLDQGTFKLVSNEVIFLSTTYNEMMKELFTRFPTPDSFTVAQARDVFGSSRKYILAFLEYLDSSGITTRSGDLRQFRINPTHIQ